MFNEEAKATGYVGSQRTQEQQRAVGQATQGRARPQTSDPRSLGEAAAVVQGVAEKVRGKV